MTDNDSNRNSANNRGRVCVNRGSLGSMNSLMGDLSFMAQDPQPGQFYFGDQFFEADRESFQKRFGDDVEMERGRQSRMSEENSQFLFKMNESRASNQRNSRGVNWVLRLPQGKNSDHFLQKMGGEQQVDGFCGNNSNRNSNELIRQALRISTEHSNPDRSLEIVMEWSDHVVDPMELQEMINRLSLQEPQMPIKPDRLSLLPPKPQYQGCICKKTKCLKLYCQCFQLGKVCSDQCECLDCCNNDNCQEERQHAIDQILEKNPEAFKTKTVEDPGSNEVQQPQVKRTVKCNCKKSKCQKKYCECYNSGQACGDLCNCEGCLNVEIPKVQMLHSNDARDTLDHDLSLDQIPHHPQKRSKL